MTERSRGPVLGGLALSAVLAMSGCAAQAGAATTPDAPIAPPTAPGPSAGTPTPMTDPQLDAVAQALGDQGRGAYSDVYSDLIVDTPPGAVTLYVTDAGRGQKLVEAAKKAHPNINTSLIRTVHAKYTRKAVDAQIQRIMPSTGTDRSIYGASANHDGSGITVTVAKDKVAAIQAKLNTLITTPSGIPVTVVAGRPVVAK